MTTTNGRLYITALSSLQRLDIQFVPKQLLKTRSPNIADIQVIGRNNPLHHYTGGKTTLTFELDFLAEEESREDVIRKCSWLESLAHNDGYEQPPERIRLTFGKMFSVTDVWVVKSVSVRYERFDAAYGFLPVQAYVSITLELSPTDNLTLNDVKWN
jgi:hypothetical protein